MRLLQEAIKFGMWGLEYVKISTWSLQILRKSAFPMLQALE